MTAHVDPTTNAPPGKRRRPAKRWLAVTLAAGILVGVTGQAVAQTFPDVPPGRFYSVAVEWAFANGITTGYGNTGEFRPDEPVSRGQMVTFLKRFEDHVIKLGVAGPKGDPGPAGPKGNPGEPATRLWAVVNVDGTLNRGRGVTSTAPLPFSGSGHYEVTFDRDVSNCAFVTSQTAATSLFGPAAARATFGKANGVEIWTQDNTGGFANRSFHLAVFC